MLCLFVPLYIAASGMQGQQANLEVIAHNIANMNTTGFRKRRIAQQDLMYVTKQSAGSITSASNTLSPTGLETGLGVKVVGVYRINQTGSPVKTEGTYHFMIEGAGYFQIQMPDGSIAYTRDGTFELSPDRIIVNRMGFTVQPGLTIPQNIINVTVNTQGEVIAQIDGQIPLQNIGQFEIAIFPNENGLAAVGDNLFLETPASGAPLTAAPGSQGYGKILQGYLESSNVSPVEEMTTLIQAQRHYEMNSKVIQAADQMLDTMTRLR